MSTREIMEINYLSQKKNLNKYEIARKNFLLKKWKCEELQDVI